MDLSECKASEWTTLKEGKVPHTPFAQQAGITLDTNFFGTLARGWKGNQNTV